MSARQPQPRPVAESLRVEIREAETELELDACRALVADTYERWYGVRFADRRADPNGRLEPFPDRFAMGLVGGQLVASAGLYVRQTYVERFGRVSDDDIAAAMARAGVEPDVARPRIEYTKLVVRYGWEGHGIGRHLLAATHCRAFLGADENGVPPLVLACGKRSVFSRFYDAMGIRTRPIKPFPKYRNHERYRSDDDPMDSRLIIPEIDVHARWYRQAMPGEVVIEPVGGLDVP